MAIADRINVNVRPGDSPGRSPRIRTTDRAADDLLAVALHAFKLLTVLLAPILPTTALARRAQFLVSTATSLDRSGKSSARDPGLRASHGSHRSEAGRRAARGRRSEGRENGRIGAQRDAERAAARPMRPRSPSTISRKVDLRIARIVNAEHVDGADKLLKLTLDVGDGRHAHGVRRHQVGLRPCDARSAA
jgi:methionyl-tRNA synthetase